MLRPVTLISITIAIAMVTIAISVAITIPVAIVSIWLLILIAQSICRLNRIYSTFQPTKYCVFAYKLFHTYELIKMDFSLS